MDPHQIVITIKPDGQIEGTVKGVSGAKCGQISEWLAKLGTQLEDRHTEDYYKPDEQGTDLGVNA